MSLPLQPSGARVRNPAPVRAYLRLLRPFLAPTAAADVLVGYALLLPTHYSRPTVALLALLAGSSVSLYCAGMVPTGVNGAATVAGDRGVAGAWVAVGAAETPQAIPAAKTQAPKEANHHPRLGRPRLPNRVP